MDVEEKYHILGLLVEEHTRNNQIWLQIQALSDLLEDKK